MLLLVLAACLEDLPDSPADPCSDWLLPNAYRYTWDQDGRTRKSRLYVPSGPGPRTLVINLHGASHSATIQRLTSGYEDHAREAGFVVLHANGTGAVKTWNGGGCCGAAQRRGVDDVAYLEAIAADLSERLCVDRILATGFSNGGILTHRWACEGQWVDAAIPVAASLEVDGCGSGEPVPVLHWHGTADEQVRYDGGIGPNSSVGVNFRGAGGSMDVWRERNGCSNEPPDVAVFGDVTCESWRGCDAPTALCTVEGGGHTWPGGTTASDQSGHITQDLSATADGYAWFEALFGEQPSPLTP